MSYKRRSSVKPNPVTMWHIRGLNNIKPLCVKCPVENCNHKTINKNGMIGHLATQHNKSELIALIVSIIEGGYVK